MKKLLLAIMCVIAPVVVTAAEVSNVYEVPGKTQAQIFNGAKEWIALNFKSANDVIQSADKDTGTIIAKGNTTYQCNGVGDCLLNLADSTLEFTLKIDTKDEKARLTFSHFNLYRIGITDHKRTEGYIGKKQEENIQKQMTAWSQHIIDSLKNSQSAEW